ncbi:hypothetical protein L7F22_069121 [Adiantum nelumboides]|nr:hypothetical protein [Adiantum nelumboides]
MRSSSLSFSLSLSTIRAQSHTHKRSPARRILRLKDSFDLGFSVSKFYSKETPMTTQSLFMAGPGMAVASSKGLQGQQCRLFPPKTGLGMVAKSVKSSSSSFQSGSGAESLNSTGNVAYGSMHVISSKNSAVAVTCDHQKILVANRGEIAVRVIRTAHEMGIPCVAVHSTIDRQALHVQLADEAVCIGEAPSSQSYLVIPNIVSAAVSHGCTMLHPGYGFLSENATFVDICRDHGLNFIGPNPESIRVMGDKATARETMRKAGVPTVPGSEGLIETTEEAIKVAHEIGFPVMIKATAGGGGRGMRLADAPEEFVKLLQVSLRTFLLFALVHQRFS